MSSPAPMPFPMAYLGGYLLFFIGWAAGMVGCILMPRTPVGGGPPPAIEVCYGLVAIGVLLFVGGALMMACVDRLKGKQPMLSVLFAMTPAPAVLGYGLNALGQYLRSSEAVGIRMALMGIGAFLIFFVGMLLDQGFHLKGSKNDWRCVCWTTLLQLGITSLVISLLPRKNLDMVAVESTFQRIAPRSA